MLSTRPQSQVSVVEDVELRVRDQAMHDLRVDQWDKRVVIAMQNQCRLPELAEPEDARPTHPSQHLIEVAEQATRAYAMCELVRQLGLRAHLTPRRFLRRSAPCKPGPGSVLAWQSSPKLGGFQGP